MTTQLGLPVKPHASPYEAIFMYDRTKRNIDDVETRLTVTGRVWPIIIN